MKLYHFPSPNPQKVHFALLELGLTCEIVPVDSYAPRVNITEKAGFSYEEFPKVRAYMDAIRSRPAWQKTPKLPGL